MPPRYAYWTILVDDQPTAFRAGSQEDLLPTFKRLKEKHPSAVMRWFQNGKLWDSRIDAQEAMRARGEMGRRGDERQAGFRSRDRDFTASRPPGFKTSRPGERRDGGKRTAWTPRGEPSTPAPARTADDKLDWKPKGEFTPARKRSERADWKPKAPRSEKPEWKPKGEFTPAPRRSEKPDWKPKSFKRPDFKRSGDDSRAAKPEWKPKGSFDREAKREWKPKTSRPQGLKTSRPQGPRTSRPQGPKTSRPQDLKTSRPPGKLEWKPKSESGSGSPLPAPASREKRKWVPKEDYKKSQGIEARRDKNWRPGGEHKDPRQKYKDAKKAKWSRFKQTIRKKWEGKKGKS